ncbi:MAG: hypothetical protein QNJ23_08855 [Woeseiaceae bacterium]|nr:hypothetical protein [Woeseiaceae bacterium]
MNRFRTTLIAIVAAGMAACGDAAVEDAPATTGSDTGAQSASTKPQSPVAIDYRIIGAPIVGQPLAIDIEVRSLIGPQPIRLQYRINDSTAMELAEAQPSQVSIAPMADNAPTVQQVSLVPLREGRLFLNVAASVDVDDGMISTAIAIPVQVGAAPRQPETNGALSTDENGDAVRSLPANES